jgi:hypothetical protein
MLDLSKSAQFRRPAGHLRAASRLLQGLRVRVTPFERLFWKSPGPPTKVRWLFVKTSYG